MIDGSNPTATPFRVQWADTPQTEYQFKTGVITAADGSEQRHPQNRYPQVKVAFTSVLMSYQHVQRVDDMLPNLMSRAVAVRDFRMNGAGRVSTDRASVVLDQWRASWAVGVRVVIDDHAGLAEHTAIISTVDPATRTISLDQPAPAELSGAHVGVGSAVTASLDEEMSSEILTDHAHAYAVKATSFRGLDPIGGAPLDVFPLTHGARSGISVTANRFIHGLDYQVGRRMEFLGYQSHRSGSRTYKIDAYQMNQSEKQSLVSFFCGVRGRHKAFDAPLLRGGTRFRFAGDLMVISHLSGDVSSSSLGLVEVPA